jgi:phosphoribosyl 1,2-cyclic phosphodiesterase
MSIRITSVGWGRSHELSSAPSTRARAPRPCLSPRFPAVRSSWRLRQIRSFRYAIFSLSPFSIPHDAAQPCGFAIAEESLFASFNARIAVATDLGVVTEEIRQRLSECDLVMLESNHDIEMLLNGWYPEDLKRRILSDVGHLSNEAAAQTLQYLAERGRLRTAVLMHLSKNNNRPKLALETVQRHLNGTEVAVAIAPRDRMSAIFTV